MVKLYKTNPNPVKISNTTLNELLNTQTGYMGDVKVLINIDKWFANA